MSPKDKAIELINKFITNEESFKAKRLNDKPIIKLQNKQKAISNALVCVEEIIRTYNSPMDDLLIKEWQEVEQEIKKL